MALRRRVSRDCASRVVASSSGVATARSGCGAGWFWITMFCWLGLPANPVSPGISTAPLVPVEGTVVVPGAFVSAGPNVPPGANEPGRVVAGSTVVWLVPMALPETPSCGAGEDPDAFAPAVTPGVGVVEVEVVVLFAELELTVLAVQELPPKPVQLPVDAAGLAVGAVLGVAVTPDGAVRTAAPVVCATTAGPERAIATAAAR